MEQDIRKLFDSEDQVTIQKLPTNHRKDFLLKLQKQNKTQKQFYVLQIAASFLFLFGFVIALYNVNSKNKDEFSMEKQMNIIEKQYLSDIEKEWQKFVSVTDDTLLIKRFDKKLTDLNDDYEALSKELESNPNNILTIEDLISNLQNRLKLLQDIQMHIHLLNENNMNYDTF